ncbi:PhzF family phenazine biosynthesis protein [Mycobacterium sp. M1]|uniref:PhzF family phenazine biosynthesis protein n=1 Tax=Mycolicibacter acidiphilus TaxID=2835306 RepID=A0ABS5RHB7_9MYCO|nr:PhzF family phenazine biosynthesis protein [Mycolicibacter acidiphilus]MBS9533666.1 PhzF family phenazine biosynthesis protein [Mycolicibacter acidiphilus]
MTAIEVLRVFTDADGAHGNPLGVVLDGAAVAEPEQRQRLAAALGYSETIFVDDPDRGRIRIYTPVTELPFAGHPAVGAAWLIARETGRTPTALDTPGGPVPTWAEGETVWVRGRLAATPPWWQERLPDAVAVAALTGPLSPEQDATQLWAWQDEASGAVRARVYAARYGITEDEACGSASMRLAAALGRDLTICHGAGSVVRARPGPPGTAELGGRVVSDGAVPNPLETRTGGDR